MNESEIKKQYVNSTQRQQEALIGLLIYIFILVYAENVYNYSTSAEGVKYCA